MTSFSAGECPDYSEGAEKEANNNFGTGSFSSVACYESRDKSAQNPKT